MNRVCCTVHLFILEMLKNKTDIKLHSYSTKHISGNPVQNGIKMNGNANR